MTERKRRPSADDDDMPSSPAWMTTYGDMMTLLMCFFILIMSFSTMEADKFKLAMGSLKGAMGALGMQKKLRPEQSWFSPNQRAKQLKAASILENVQNLKEMIKKNNLQEQVDVYVDDSEVDIQIKDKVLFDIGTSELRPQYLKIMSMIANQLVRHAKEIKVKGYTDNSPIRTAKYPSNWELSFDRALSVVKYLVNNERIDPTKISAAGYGEHHPIVPNNTPENRARNRRVVLNFKL